MKIITLAVAAPVNGPLRQPSEGPLTVSDELAEQLKVAGVLDGEPEDLPDTDAEQSSETTPKKPQRGAAKEA